MICWDVRRINEFKDKDFCVQPVAGIRRSDESQRVKKGNNVATEFAEHLRANTQSLERRPAKLLKLDGE